MGLFVPRVVPDYGLEHRNSGSLPAKEIGMQCKSQQIENQSMISGGVVVVPVYVLQ
jgi:hypothetical protein